MSLFEHVALEPPDPILGLTSAFAEDTRESKINLGVGAYKSAELKSFVLSSVTKAEEKLLSSLSKKDYLPIDGDKEYIASLKKLVFGERSPLLQDNRIYGVQTIGGTGALRLGADFLFQEFGQKVFLSNPTWANHKPIFKQVGFSVDFYPYFNKSKNLLDMDKMCEFLATVPDESLLLFHASCHNPSGMDPSQEEWTRIADVLEGKKIVPFFDCAYQGFGEGLEEDVFPIRLFAERGFEMLVAYSCSKNFGLYGERVGALFFVAAAADVLEKVASRVKVLVRRNYSNPPLHGASIVKTILGDEGLKREWEGELASMRDRVNAMRQALASSLMTKGGQHDFSFLKKQKGMFSFSGLEKDQVDQLKVEFGIYMPSSGRVNVAGLASGNLEYVADAFNSVLEGSMA